MSTSRDKPLLSLAAIGHHSDGKTTLTAALLTALAKRPGCRAEVKTVAQLDRRDDPLFVSHYESFPRGTVLPTKVSYETPSRRIAHIDCSGRRNRVRATASLLASVDSALIVVSAADGPRAQTFELVRLAAAVGITQFVTFINKCDLAEDPELLDIIESEVREVVTDVGADGDDMPVLRGAALPALSGDHQWQVTIEALIDAIDRDFQLTPYDASPPTVITLDVLHRRYPVGDPKRVLVEGVVRHGQVSRGQRLMLRGARFDQPVQVGITSIETFHVPVDEAGAGEHIGIMLEAQTKRFDRNRLRKGDLLVSATTHHTFHKLFRARIHLLSAHQGGRHTPMFTGDQVLFFFGSATAVGELEMIPDSLGALPGREVEVWVSLHRPTYLAVDMPFAFRDGCDGFARETGGAPAWSGTAGTGVILEIKTGKASTGRRDS